MPFTVPTLTQAQTALASRLNDPNNVHWVAAELTLYLQEALRTFNAWMSLYRDQGTVTPQQAVPFYDLSSALSGSLRAYTVTNWNLVTEIQYALLEPAAAGGTWTGTDQFTLQQVSDAIQRRRDQFLQETGAVLTWTERPYTMTASGRYALAEQVLTVRRAAWRPNATQLLQPLQRTDEWASNHFSPGWRTASAAPTTYSVSVTPPITMQVLSAPNGDGVLDLVAVQAGDPIVTNTQAVLGIPDDWTWVVKYGALADLLQADGLARDLPRAQYCLSRWDQGIAAASVAGVVLTAQIAGQPYPIDNLASADRFWPLWQSVTGSPQKVLTAGQNLIALAPPPGGVIPTITLDVVRNAPIPVNPGDVLQLTADLYDPLLDYAEHLALFKEGVGMVEQSMPLLQNALRTAGVTLKLQQASQPARAPLLAQQRNDESTEARSADPVSVGS